MDGGGRNRVEHRRRGTQMRRGGDVDVMHLAVSWSVCAPFRAQYFYSRREEGWQSWHDESVSVHAAGVPAPGDHTLSVGAWHTGSNEVRHDSRIVEQEH